MLLAYRAGRKVFQPDGEQGFAILGDKGALRFSLTEDKLWLYSEEDLFPSGFRGWTAITVPNAYAASFNAEDRRLR